MHDSPVTQFGTHLNDESKTDTQNEPQNENYYYSRLQQQVSFEERFFFLNDILCMHRNISETMGQYNGAKSYCGASCELRTIAAITASSMSGAIYV